VSAEPDAVRQARDAALGMAVGVVPLAGVAGLLGALTSDYGAWLRWLLAPVLVGLMGLATLCFALLVADRVGRRFLRMHPMPVGRAVLVGASILAGLVLVAALPATWPVIIGLGVVCCALGAAVVAGAALDL
jgi:hypothetical protein